MEATKILNSNPIWKDRWLWVVPLKEGCIPESLKVDRRGVMDPYNIFQVHYDNIKVSRRRGGPLSRSITVVVLSAVLAFLIWFFFLGGASFLGVLS